MTLSRRGSLFLLGVAAWTTLIWIVLIKNVAADTLHGESFKVVHFTLAAISLSLAVGTALIGVRGLRATGLRGRAPASRPAQPAAGAVPAGDVQADTAPVEELAAS